MPFFELLELNGAVRLSDYSTSGSTTTFKGGVNWKPISGSAAARLILGRVPRADDWRVVRNQTRFDQSLEDPCSSHAGNKAPRNFQNDPTVKANCIALGIPADGSYQQINPQLSVLTGGNDALKAGKVEELGCSAAFSARGHCRGCRSRRTITTSRSMVRSRRSARRPPLNSCVLNNDPAACALITRLSNGQVTQIRGLLQNIAGIKTEGLDVNFAYRTRQASWGTFGFTWNNNFLFNYHVTVPTATGLRRSSGKEPSSGSPDQAFPKWKSIGILDWNWNDLRSDA